MALRSRSRAATASSGPGRGPASDGRTRHRRRPYPRNRARYRYASAEELRRRAEVLFGERAVRRRELGEEAAGRDEGVGAPDVPYAEPHIPYADMDVGDDVPPDGGGVGDHAPPVAADVDAGAQARHGVRAWRGRVGPVLRERMPVWLQARCGLERRSVVALTALLVVAAAFAVQHFWTGRTLSVRPPEVVQAAAPFAEAAQAEGEPSKAPGGPAAGGTAAAEIVVDVSGKVREPGIQRLPAGSRVVDALRAAGGVRPGTNTDGLNRARFLVDGEQVIVGGPVAGSGSAPVAGGTAVGGQAGSAAAPTAPVSLNTATVDQLETLPGVGPVLAQHIIDYRTQHGGFRSVDQLRDVNGIGDRRFADLRDLVQP
ncbi:ComEA family DNA-binding protein [Streptomyces sp. GESEQ-4]|uniref:ComEA family DNA-binding protein n=1 Tax=Streptomyces sp. GESEQ-4 TaxID=2812655 RepID=UPI001B32D921|nr:ComEA family DNA-binding protein [Streptomyces sp. GESEQ-4]